MSEQEARDEETKFPDPTKPSTRHWLPEAEPAHQGGQEEELPDPTKPAGAADRVPAEEA